MKLNALPILALLLPTAVFAAPAVGADYDALLAELSADYPDRGQYSKSGRTLVETRSDRELRFRVVRGDAEAIWLNNKAKVRITCRIRAKAATKRRECTTRIANGTSKAFDVRDIPMPSLVKAERWAEIYNEMAKSLRREFLKEIVADFNQQFDSRYVLKSPIGNRCNLKLTDVAQHQDYKFDAREAKTSFYAADGLYEAKIECKNGTGTCINVVGGPNQSTLRVGTAVLSEAQVVADSLNDLHEICEL